MQVVLNKTLEKSLWVCNFCRETNVRPDFIIEVIQLLKDGKSAVGFVNAEKFREAIRYRLSSVGFDNIDIDIYKGVVKFTDQTTMSWTLSSTTL